MCNRKVYVFYTQMKLALVCVAVAFVSGLCQADKLQDTVNRIRDEYSTKFSNIRTDLKTLGGDLKDLAVHKVKSLGGQTIQGEDSSWSNLSILKVRLW